MKLKYIITVFFLYSTIAIFPNDMNTISGKVYGIDAEKNKIILPKATLQWVGTNEGTITDNSGNFSIKKHKNTNKIIVSYTGYKKDTVEIDLEKDNIELVLKSIYEYEEINVVGDKPAELISRASVNNSVTITGVGLRKAACCNLSESFQTNASVDVDYSDAISGAKQIKLLGLQGTYSQLMTEKIPNLRGIASTYGLSYIPGPWMESIQIAKGTSSVSTGYESITGQINVEYKKPEESEPLFINLYANHKGMLEANGYSAYKLNDKLSTMLFLHGNYMNNQIDHNDDSFMDMPLLNQFNVMNRWSFNNSFMESKTVLKALYEDRESGQMNYYPDKNTNLYGIGIKTERYEFYTKNGFFINDELQQSIGTMASFIHHNQNSFYGLNNYNGTQNSVYLNILFQSDLIFGEHHHSDDAEKDEHEGHAEHSEHDECADEYPKHNYTIGLNFSYDDYKEKFQDTTLDRIESVPGIFLEYKLSPIENLTFIAGLRNDFHNKFGNFFTPRLHIKYDLENGTILRASVGKGFHIANILSENSGIMASSRTFSIDEELKPEEAWNFGLNSTSDINLFGIDFTINLEYYRTEFLNQVIVDLEKNVNAIHFYNLDGLSYSNSYQIDVNFAPFSRFNISTAYRFNDVKTTIDGILIDKPLISHHKAFINFSYSTNDNDWIFDFTVEYNGKGRLPNTSSNPEEYRLNEEFPDFVQLYAQITKKFGAFEAYIGGENLTNYRQKNPIIAYNKPFSKYFDSSIVWGPISGAVYYLGVRYNIN